jgi:hypothetical protein
MRSNNYPRNKQKINQKIHVDLVQKYLDVLENTITGDADVNHVRAFHEAWETKVMQDKIAIAKSSALVHGQFFEEMVVANGEPVKFPMRLYLN